MKVHMLRINPWLNYEVIRPEDGSDNLFVWLRFKEGFGEDIVFNIKGIYHAENWYDSLTDEHKEEHARAQEECDHLATVEEVNRH